MTSDRRIKIGIGRYTYVICGIHVGSSMIDYVHSRQGNTAEQCFWCRCHFVDNEDCPALTKHRNPET